MRSLFLILSLLSTMSHAVTETEFIGLRPAKDGKVDLVFKSNGDKAVIHDDDGMATLATMQRVYADTYLKANAEDRAKWTEAVPNTESASVKKIFTKALEMAVKTYGDAEENKATADKLKEIQKAIADAGDKALGKAVFDKIGELLEESLKDHVYDTQVGNKKYREMALVNEPFEDLFLHGFFADRLPAFKLADSVEGSKLRTELLPDVKRIAVEYASLGVPSRRRARQPQRPEPAPLPVPDPRMFAGAAPPTH